MEMRNCFRPQKTEGLSRNLVRAFRLRTSKNARECTCCSSMPQSAQGAQTRVWALPWRCRLPVCQCQCQFDTIRPRCRCLHRCACVYVAPQALALWRSPAWAQRRRRRCCCRRAGWAARRRQSCLRRAGCHRTTARRPTAACNAMSLGNPCNQLSSIAIA